MKRYVTIGLGNFGLNLARTLEESGCEVLGIDSSREAVDAAKDYITRAVIADGANRETLQSLMLKDFDGAIVSIGQDMAPSILIALYLKELDIKRLIVRAVSDDHVKILEQIGVSETIFPETAAAVRLGKRLASKNAVDYLPLGGKHSIVEVIPQKSFIGKSLRELQITSRFHCQVIALKITDSKSAPDITREDNLIIPPEADDIITKDTIMIIIGKDSDIKKLQRGK